MRKLLFVLSLLGCGATLLSGQVAAEANAAYRTAEGRARLAQPDIQLFSNPVKLSAHLWFPGFVKSPEHAFSADVILLHPQARGTLAGITPAALVDYTVAWRDDLVTWRELLERLPQTDHMTAYRYQRRRGLFG